MLACRNISADKAAFCPVFSLLPEALSNHFTGTPKMPLKLSAITAASEVLLLSGIPYDNSIDKRVWHRIADAPKSGNL